MDAGRMTPAPLLASRLVPSAGTLLTTALGCDGRLSRLATTSTFHSAGTSPASLSALALVRLKRKIRRAPSLCMA